MATTIYLSSTYEDLKEYRRAVFGALRKSGYQVVAMEDYAAADHRPVDQCLKDVERADIYVGLFAFRYRYVPPPQHQNLKGLSITELEFRHAEALQKPCLNFVVNDSTPWPRLYDDAYKSEDKGERIRALRQYLLTEKLVSTFGSPYELASLVVAGVTKHLEGKKQHEYVTTYEPATSSPITWDIEKNGSPYPGLMNFTREYAPVFFGRDLEVREILDRMHLPEGRFILVSGDSGVGKSSLLAAGVLPVVEERGLPGGERCEILHMLPGKAQLPWASLLMAGLGSFAIHAGLRPDEVLEQLNRDPSSLTEHLNTITKKATKSSTLLLFLDQMEELFTSQDITQSNRFLMALYHAVQEKTLWVVATIRSDYLHYCHRHSEMVKVLRGQGHYPLGPVDRVMMQEMIVKPAQRAGLNLSDSFARRLIDDTGEDLANLPLLAFVLNQLFEKRQDHELSETVYKAIGGVAGAIGAHVKRVEDKIQTEMGDKMAEVLSSIFQTLVNIHKEEGVPTRNRPLVSGFEAHQQKIVDLLVTERLLRTEGEGETATVSISHEKLFSVWPALRNYVETHKKMLMDRTLLEIQAGRWSDGGKRWFQFGLLSQEYKDLRAVAPTSSGLAKEYFSARRRNLWVRQISALLLFLDALALAWLGELGLHHSFLQLQSYFIAIHVEPDVEILSAGTFRQGDIHGQGDKTEQPVHEVTVKRFAIGRFEVTFEEYNRFFIATGRSVPQDYVLGHGTWPVTNVTWQEAKHYAAWLSEQTGRRYRLPTESEWEYAARSGRKDDIWAGTSDANKLPFIASYRATSHNGPRPADFSPGPRLHDMSGNVSEWVEDCWHDNYQNAPSDGSAWLDAGGGNCNLRVHRGGSWTDPLMSLRVSFRDKSATGSNGAGSVIGFRLALDIE